MDLDRQSNIELLAGYRGKLDELKNLLGLSFTQLEIDIALGNAIAYSRLDTADYLLSLGARLDHYDYDGVYYAVHNNELDGLKYAISKGVDINLRDGMPLNTSIIISTNTKDLTMTKWLLDNGANVNLLTNESLFVLDKYGTEGLKDLIKSAQQKGGM